MACAVSRASTNDFSFIDTNRVNILAPLKVSRLIQMDWMIPEKLKKRVSYAQFVVNSIDKLENCQTEYSETGRLSW